MSNDQGSECTITLQDGTHYDLSSLASAKADYQTTGGNSTFNLNVCRGVVGEVWNVDNPETVGGYFNKEAGDFSLGRVNSTLHISPATNEPMIYLQNGSPCPTNPQEYASTVIRFICSPTTFEAGTPKLIAALPPLDTDQSCHFVFEWSTHVACATNPKAKLEQGHFIAFFAFVLIAILTWFGGHTLYNRYYLKRRGMDQFPVPSVSAPKLPKLGRGDNSGSKPWSFGRRSQRGYSGLRSDEHAQENEGFAGRFSLDDDEDEDLTGTGAEDARALGGETDAWRGQRSNGTEGQSKVGVHQGLVDV